MCDGLRLGASRSQPEGASPHVRQQDDAARGGAIPATRGWHSSLRSARGWRCPSSAGCSRVPLCCAAGNGEAFDDLAITLAQCNQLCDLDFARSGLARPTRAWCCKCAECHGGWLRPVQALDRATPPSFACRSEPCALGVEHVRDSAVVRHSTDETGPRCAQGCAFVHHAPVSAASDAKPSST